MTDQSKVAGTGASGRRRRPGRKAAALTAVLLAGMAVAGDAWADRIVLKSGEVIEGSIIEATRNTVIVLRSIGGMRQMPIEDIQEVRIDLARGEQLVGQLLGWSDGVYEVRSGDEILRVSESGILSRATRRETARQEPARPPGEQQSTAAAAPSIVADEPAAEPTAERASEGQDRGSAVTAAGSGAAAAQARRAAAGEAERQASGTEAQAAPDADLPASSTEAPAAVDAASEASPAEARAAADAESEARDAEAQAAADADSQASETETQAAADGESEASEAEAQSAADADSQVVAGEQHAAVGDQGILAVKASADPPEPGARSMVFNIELSQPAKQTVVLIYGTVDGTAKAGEDYEAQQGMVTLAPGATTAEVQVPLIEGAQDEDEKRFELVLMADPKVADVVDRRVIATIKGAD
ncbi:MAG TPA: Calx-beta domain-containing protein [Geminicoccaceae bacterium]